MLQVAWPARDRPKSRRHRRIPANSGSVTQAIGGGILVGVIIFGVGYRFRRLALDRGRKLSC